MIKRLFFMILAGTALAGTAVLALAWVLAPAPMGPQAEPVGDCLVLAGDGRALGNLASPEARGGPWLAPGNIPPLVKAAALAAEDRRFYDHFGVDPLALARAGWQNLTSGRVVSGGSTISMQTARLLGNAPRSLWGKLIQIIQALKLEAAWTKEQILAAYLNRAPFGGPIQGLGAASRLLYGKDPGRLSPAEATLLLALPQDPSRLLRPKNRARLLARRERILVAMAEMGVLSGPALARALNEPISLAPLPGPPLAPHFVRALGRALPSPRPRLVRTHLDRELQAAISAMVRDTVGMRRGEGLRQAAALVIRNQDRAILAWVGSTDFSDPAGGQVDGVLARRQPGSALKPFIYALALEEGFSLDDPILDEPLGLLVSEGVFRPLDYDRGFRGEVPLKVALASSLNLPALRLTARLDPRRVLGRLRGLGLDLPKPAEHYGLGLALGNGEVSLLELTSAYAALAGGGRWSPPLLHADQKKPQASAVMDPMACGLVARALADDGARAPGFGAGSLLRLPFPAAVKTGTSQRHRDNWCLGFTEKYTVGVWVGNFEGRPMAGVSGVTGAGPLWRRIMLHLHRLSPGDLPVALSPGAAAPAPRSGTPAEPEPPRILVPFPGAAYALDPDVPQKLQVLTCRARIPALARTHWRLDGRDLGAITSPEEVRIPMTPGRHLLELTVWQKGRPWRTGVEFTVH